MWMTMGASLALAGMSRAQPIASQPRLHVSFPGNPAGQTELAAAVPLGEDSLWVTVVAPGADASHPVPKPIATGTKIELVGHDPVSTPKSMKGHLFVLELIFHFLKFGMKQ